MPQESTFIPLGGGLDLITPAIRTPPGRAIGAVNYEAGPRGYARIDGLEIYDGQAKPSAASYWVLNYDAGEAAISEGDTVTGGTSSATGVALIDAVISSGSYAGSDAVGYLVLTAVSGTFQDDEDLEVSATKKSVANGTPLKRGATDDDDDDTWLQDAIETARGDIAAVTGSGVIRGLGLLDGTLYAFRNNAGGTAGTMYKATSSGWTLQSFGKELAFTSGSTEIAEQDTITGLISGATAVAERIVLQSGTWAGGDAAGYLVLSGQSGTFQSEGIEVSGGGDLATIAGDSSAITLTAGGRYECMEHNFFGASNLNRMYFVNTVDTAFEWDGTVLAPIKTGMTTDTPKHIAAHKNQLFLSFAGGSVQHSGLGAPFSWSAVTGALEIGLGQEVTGFSQDMLTALAILGRNKIAVLYGNDSSDWVLEELRDDAGAVEWTAQRLGNLLYLDDHGIRDLRAAQQYGDFRMGTISQMIEPLFRSKKKASVTAKASLRCRAKDQYRLFWSDNTGITIYLGKKTPEITTFDYGFAAECAISGEDSSGNEIMFIGDNAGKVYQIDSGSSLNGTELEAMLRLPFNHVGSPGWNKRFHSAVLELDAPVDAAIGILVEYEYANPSEPPSEEQSFTVRGGGAFYGLGDWDDFYWSSAVEGLAEADLEGEGTNLSIGIVSRSTYEAPPLIHGVLIYYSQRGRARARAQG
tara:strand:+ start:683 stop:2767 length:2085 start_codon:yes stop_codon:yes gene_type:complete